MNIQPKIVFRIEMSTAELKLIRRALTLHGGNGIILCEKITNQIQKGRQELVVAIDASLKLEETVAAEVVIPPKKDE